MLGARRRASAYWVGDRRDDCIPSQILLSCSEPHVAPAVAVVVKTDLRSRDQMALPMSEP
jgi:hypothetical protein